jgi:hypothetical protein
MRRITARATAAKIEAMQVKIEAMQVKIDTLAGKADSELSEALSGVSAALELAIELLHARLSATEQMRNEIKSN